LIELIDRPHTLDVVANLKILLEREDWEFRFTVNFFLRGEQYGDDPYKNLLKRLDDFLEKEGVSYG
jgi:hypothetical protein